MKWNMWLSPKPTYFTPSDTCEAGSREEALDVFDKRWSAAKGTMTVRRALAEGKTTHNDKRSKQ